MEARYLSKGDVGWGELYRLWDGVSETVVMGSVAYRVITPNGKEEALFYPMGTELSMYASTSFSAGDKVKSKKKAVKVAPKAADVSLDEG